jgi:hypothetical protein
VETLGHDTVAIPKSLPGERFAPMSMPIVHHVWQKSQTQGSARTLLLTLAIHANDCCGVAWVSDTTLRHAVNVSRQRIHELKNAVKATGELIIVERPGYTNLYFVAWQGQPVGGQGAYRAAPGSTHEPGCPLRRGMPVTKGGVSGASDTQGSGGSDTPCQAGLTQTTRDNDTENEGRSLSPGNGPDGPPTRTLPPDRLERLGLTRNSAAWLAYVSLSQEETADDQGASRMAKFKDGDQVKVIDAPTDKHHLVGKIGTVRPPQGFDYDQDLVFVSFDEGVRDGFTEHQLEKVD